MNTAGRNEDWTGPQLAAQLAALNGVAPETLAHLVWRSTTHAGGPEIQSFRAADELSAFPQAELPGWLARHRLHGAGRLGLSLLIIREMLDEAGLIRECTLEHRRGALDGPLHGDPARVEFTGPARMVRLYQVQRDGRLKEVASTMDGLPTRHRVPAQMAGEMAALQVHFGSGLQVIDIREPTLFETMAGCGTIAHVRLPDGREVGCGIGWHGPVAFVLTAAFPRFAVALVLPPDTEAAMQAVLLDDRLVRHETRLDQAGLALIARRRGTDQLFLLRMDGGKVRTDVYEPAPEAVASEDQANWMRYAETYEHLAILDAWRDDGSDDLQVVSGEASGQIWRHHVDRDGVETWRRPDEEAAAGWLYRDRLKPGTLAAAATGAAAPVAAPEQAELADLLDAPPDSLLAKAEAYVTAIATLHDAQDQAAEPDATLADLLGYLRTLLPALETLDATNAAAELGALLLRLEDGDIPPARLGGALSRISGRLTEELSATRLMALAPLQWRRMTDPAPFGRAVEDALPEAAYDIEEAALCLALRRPTAASFHCMRVIEAGLAALGVTGRADLSDEDRTWSRIIAAFRRTASVNQADLLAPLEQVRRCWHGARLAPAAKYTEAEAERLFRAVGRFTAALAEALTRIRNV